MQIVIRMIDEGTTFTEFLKFDLDNLTEDSVEAVTQTREWWPDPGIFVHWNVTCGLERFDGGHQILVTYERDRQEDEEVRRFLKKAEDYRWYCGEYRIFVTQDPDTNRVISPRRFEWNSEHPKQEAIKGSWRVIDGQRPIREKEQAEREWRLRGEVLDEDDGKCVISGETTAAVLDAAHICPVADGGEDSIQNTIILRTDIHRLFDRGMFRINPKNGKVSKNRISRNLSGKYRKLLRNARIPQGTLQRVREALRTRWDNSSPDARGEAGNT